MLTPATAARADSAASCSTPLYVPKFIAAGTITQAILNDPNTILRNQIQHQNISETMVIGVSTNPASPLSGVPLAGGPLTPSFGGGPANIAFLLGVPNPPPSAQGPMRKPYKWTRFSGSKP